MTRYLLLGLLLGVSAGLSAASLPQILGFGRTALGVNHYMLVSSDGTLHIN